MGLLEGLIARGQRVGLHMEQVEILKANVEASGCARGALWPAGGMGQQSCWA